MQKKKLKSRYTSTDTWKAFYHMNLVKIERKILKKPIQRFHFNGQHQTLVKCLMTGKETPMCSGVSRQHKLTYLTSAEITFYFLYFN